MVEVSVIVPCYNQAQYLDKCLSSVLDQTFDNWECIVINDGSPDDTDIQIQKWIEKDSRFVYYKQENSGLSNARNKGIELSRGSYILPLDADDYICNKYVENCYKEIIRSVDIKIVYGNGFFFGEKNENWNLPQYSFDLLLRGNMIFCTALYRKADWYVNNGYDKNMKYGLEDWEFWINLLKRGGSVSKINNCTFFYRIKTVSMFKAMKEEHVVYLYNYVFYKHNELYNFNSIADHFKLVDIEKDPGKYLSFKKLVWLCINKIINKISQVL